MNSQEHHTDGNQPGSQEDVSAGRAADHPDTNCGCASMMAQMAGSKGECCGGMMKDMMAKCAKTFAVCGSLLLIAIIAAVTLIVIL